MSNLKGKKILLGITGSIAAYKSAELVRLLRALQADVRVVMTKDACQFITELTLQALSGQPVHTELLDPVSEASMSHITLAKWADLILIAPASANTMAKFAAGIADDLLSTLYLASSAPIAIVPAMNQQMWRHLATENNKKVLQARGVLFWGPAQGEQACGDVGPGRMLEPSDTIGHLEDFFSPKILSGLKILITAGPTHEPIDPVRYISNHSSGKMGYELVKAAVELGAKVLLITGPTKLPIPIGVETIHVQTAEEMHTAVMQHVNEQNIMIAAAAVADYRCSNIATQKIKKTDTLKLDLQKNPDILMEVGQLKKHPFLVGFAAETENLLTNARTKLQKKNLDMIIANQVAAKDSGFNSDFNEVSLITPQQQIDFPLTSKNQLAKKLISAIWVEYRQQH